MNSILLAIATLCGTHQPTDPRAKVICQTAMIECAERNGWDEKAVAACYVKMHKE